MSDDCDDACERCGKTRPIMVVMERGRGGPWRLCSTCYLEGIRPMDYGTQKVEREVVAVIPSSAPARTPAAVATKTTKTKRKKSA